MWAISVRANGRKELAMSSGMIRLSVDRTDSILSGRSNVERAATTRLWMRPGKEASKRTLDGKNARFPSTLSYLTVRAICSFRRVLIVTTELVEPASAATTSMAMANRCPGGSVKILFPSSFFGTSRGPWAKFPFGPYTPSMNKFTELCVQEIVSIVTLTGLRFVILMCFFLLSVTEMVPMLRSKLESEHSRTSPCSTWQCNFPWYTCNGIFIAVTFVDSSKSLV
mmetsp:Transcript_25304/g.72855  ORF Transcript_25304/g.72855 Transcript_25304/m.72855 type:complete len:225 (-) Transcript_25304:1471-2145(-)